MIVWGGQNKNGQILNGAKYKLERDQWVGVLTNLVEVGRFLHTAVWTGNEMIIWGGYVDNERVTASGAAYVPTTSNWKPIISNIEPRGGHTAVWTGSEMIVWAGVGLNKYLNTGGRYSPSSNQWQLTSQDQAPSPRFGHTAVWTGSEMIIWGGYEASGKLAEGGRIYNPTKDAWSHLPTDQKPEGKILNSLVWTGNQIIIWGGSDGQTLLNSGWTFKTGE